MTNLTAVASIQADGCIHLVVTYLDRAPSRYNPARYTTVRNIDGSNRFMLDDGGWSFMPDDLLRHPAVRVALDTLPKQAEHHVYDYNWHIWKRRLAA